MKCRRVMPIAMAVLVASAGAGGQESAATLLEKAVFAEETQGDLAKAMAIYQRIVDDAEAARPHVARAAYRLGLCHLKKGDRAKAAEALRQAAARFPDQAATAAAAYRQLARLLPGMEYRYVDKAVSAFEDKADVSSPEGAWAAWQRASGRMDAKALAGLSWVGPAAADIEQSWKQAGAEDLEIYRKALLGSRLIDVVIYRGDLAWTVSVLSLPQGKGRDPYSLRSLGQIDGAWKSLGEDRCPTAAAAWAAIERKKERAYAQFESVKKQSAAPAAGGAATREAEQLASQGWALWRGRKLAEAERVFAEAVGKDPSCADAWNGLGWSQLNQGKPLSAKASFDKCLAVDARHAAAWNGLGWIAKGRGEAKEAIACWEKAIEATPSATAALNGLATTCMELKQYDKAAEYYEMWLKFEPANAQVRRDLERARRSGQGPKLDPAPWKDGEVTHLGIQAAGGAEFGVIIYSARAVGRGGKAVWRIESNMVVGATNMRQYTRVDAEAGSFAPLSGTTDSSVLGTVRATYGPGKVDLRSPDGKSRTVNLDATRYDNEQVLFLIRRLPLAKDYEADIPIFPVTSAAVDVTGRARVTGREKLVVPAGTFDCHKVALAVHSGATRLLEHTLWVSADENRYVVKYDSGSAVLALKKVESRKADAPLRVDDAGGLVSFDVPAGWWAYRRAGRDEGRTLTDLLAPDATVWAGFATGRREKDDGDIRKIAEKDADMVKGFLKGYKIRPDGWTAPEVAGMPGARYVADYEENGKRKIEYRTYLLGESAVYWFVFRVDQGAFDGWKKLFDNIVGGLKTKAL